MRKIKKKGGQNDAQMLVWISFRHEKCVLNDFHVDCNRDKIEPFECEVS